MKNPSKSQPAKFHIQEDPSENLEFLFAPGKIEALVREGRTPLKIGNNRSKGGEVRIYYQVAPRGYKPEDVKKTYVTADGAYAFVYQDGTQRIGSTYNLTEKRAKSLEARVAAERANGVKPNSKA